MVSSNIGLIEEELATKEDEANKTRLIYEEESEALKIWNSFDYYPFPAA